MAHHSRLRTSSPSFNPMDKSRDTGPIVLAFALAATPLLVRVLSPGVPEAGDGVLHYQYARWCWQHPALLLDLWAKPVFTLLASPFAQLGAWGVVLFNVLCAAATAIGIGMIVRGRVARWLAPLALLTAPVYFHTVLSGMTEVLFGAATIGVVWLLRKERVKQALMLASFMPLMRPEWIAFIPCVVAYAAWHRTWRQLPWLLLGSTAYAVGSFVAFGEPLRFFLRDPYAGVKAYGTGASDHFVRHMDEVLGIPLIVLLLAAIALWPFVRGKSKPQRRVFTGMALLTIAPALVILFIHSYAWWKGGHGSLGLLRVLGTGIPLVVLFVLHTASEAASAWGGLLRARATARWALIGTVSLLLGSCGIASLIHHVQIPVQQSAEQEMLLRTGKRVQELDTMGRYVVYQDPFIAYAAGLDPFASTPPRMIWSVEKSQVGLGMGIGDLLVWDAHFGPNEGKLPLERVMNDPLMRMIEMVVPTGYVDVSGEYPMEVYIFRRLPGQRLVSSDTLYALGDASPLVARFEQAPCVEPTTGVTCFTEGEFPFTLEALPLEGTNKLFDEITLHGELATAPRDTISLFVVFVENQGNKQLRYHQLCIKEASFHLTVRVPQRPAGSTNKLYIWNRRAHPLALRSLVLTRSIWDQQ